MNDTNRRNAGGYNHICLGVGKCPACQLLNQLVESQPETPETDGERHMNKSWKNQIGPTPKEMLESLQLGTGRASVMPEAPKGPNNRTFSHVEDGWIVYTYGSEFKVRPRPDGEWDFLSHWSGSEGVPYPNNNVSDRQVVEWFEELLAYLIDHGEWEPADQGKEEEKTEEHKIDFSTAPTHYSRKLVEVKDGLFCYLFNPSGTKREAFRTECDGLVAWEIWSYRLDGTRSLMSTVKSGDPLWIWFESLNTWWETQGAAMEKQKEDHHDCGVWPSKFKVNDKVRINDDCSEQCFCGKMGEIIETYTPGEHQYQYLVRLNGIGDRAFNAMEMELLEEEVLLKFDVDRAVEYAQDFREDVVFKRGRTKLNATQWKHERTESKNMVIGAIDGKLYLKSRPYNGPFEDSVLADKLTEALDWSPSLVEAVEIAVSDINKMIAAGQICLTTPDDWNALKGILDNLYNKAKK